MNPTEPPAPARRHRVARALVRALLRVTLVLAVVVGLFYAIENFRGSRAWSAERSRLVTQGTTFELSQVIPGPVPAASNFAELPEIRPIFEYEPGKGFLSTNGYRMAMDLFNFTPRDPWRAKEPGRSTWRQAQATDLAAWQAYFRLPPTAAQREIQAGVARIPTLPDAAQTPARDVLDALECLRPGMDLVARRVREREQARYPLRYEDGYACLLPHLALLKGASHRYALRASARLAENRTAEALDDIETILRLANTLETEPFLISLLVRAAMVDVALQPAWDGLSTHAFTADQAARLQRLFSGVDLIPHWRRAMAMERAGVVRFVTESVSRPGGRKHMAAVWDMLSVTDERSLELYFLLAPRGWFYASLAATSQAIDTLAHAETRDIPRLVKEWPGPFQTNSVRMVVFSRFILPQKESSTLAGNFSRIVRHQTHLRMAATAMALERHRLARGEFPGGIAVLVPAFLASAPTDPIDGAPLRYRRNAASGYTLWSIGQDAVDQQGVLPAGTSDELADSGDWVWKIGP